MIPDVGGSEAVQRAALLAARLPPRPGSDAAVATDRANNTDQTAPANHAAAIDRECETDQVDPVAPASTKPNGSNGSAGRAANGGDTPAPNKPFLSPKHLAELRSSGLTDETIALAGIYTERNCAAIARMLNWKSYPNKRGAALVFPIILPGHTNPHAHRVKPSNPRAETKNGKTRAVKYESPKGGGALVFFPPRARLHGWYRDTARALIWTEGEKKASAADQLGFACVGLTGVDCAHDKQHFVFESEYILHPHIRDHVAIANRRHVVVFDADSKTNPRVMGAARRIERMLVAAGATDVRFVCPPSLEAKGLDDFFVTHGEQATRDLIESASAGAFTESADAEADTNRDDRPRIMITADLHSTVAQAVATLEGDTEIYQRDAQLVRVVRVADAEHEREGMATGSPQIRALARATLRERLSAVGRYLKPVKNKLVAVEPPQSIADCVAARGEWSTVRPITGVIETPSMRPDGSVIDAGGLDAATGYLYMPSRQFPAIPAHPTIDDARAALCDLIEPFAEFDFASDAARHVAVAAILALVARPAIGGPVPAFVFDASAAGSGKSLIAATITTLAHGRAAGVKTWPNDDEGELEKVLGGYALRGTQVVLFDNLRSAFAGGAIDKTLTAHDRVDLRVLGVSEVPTLQWRAVILATGNNIQIAGDTPRRVLVSRLEPMCERPEERTGFQIPRLADWSVDNHPRIVCAALTLLAAYNAAGRPAQDLGGWGSYEKFRDLIVAALVWAGAPNVMSCRPTTLGQVSDELAVLGVLLAKLPEIAPDGISARDLIARLYPPERTRTINNGFDPPPDGWDNLREAVETLAPPNRGQPPNPLRVGNALRVHVRRVVDGRYLDPNPDRDKISRWISRAVPP